MIRPIKLLAVKYVKPRDATDSIGYIGALFLLAGIFMVGQKMALGWGMQLIASFIFIYIGYHVKQNFLLILNITIALICIMNWYSWALG